MINRCVGKQALATGRLLTAILCALLCASISWAQVAWEPEVRLTEDPMRSDSPSICAGANGSLHLAWWDARVGNAEIYYKRSTNGGSSFSSDVNLTSGPEPSYYLVFPFICCDLSGRIHVVWSHLRDRRDGTEIYYQRSTDQGATWEKEQRLTFDPAYTNYPFLCFDALEGTHLVFEDWRGGSQESVIFYKRGFQSGQPRPDIKLNGDDGPLGVSHTQKAVMTIDLDAGALAGVEHDWWVFGQHDTTSCYWLRYPHGWTPSTVPMRAFAGPLRKLDNLTIAEGKIPIGSWLFTFGVDTRNDNYEEIFIDCVQVDSN